MNAYLYLATLLTVSAWSFSRGGAPERAAMAAIVVAVFATAAVASHRIFGGREVGVFAVDTILTFVIVTLALLAERFWLLWLAAILIVSLLLQLAIWYAPLYYRDVYLILHAMSAYPTLILILVGTLRHRHRMKTKGFDPSWSRGNRA